MPTVLQGWVVCNLNGDGSVVAQTFSESEKMAIASWLELSKKLGHGHLSWDYWKMQNYTARRAVIHLQKE